MAEALSSYRADFTRLSFLDFSAEIRNQIYGLVLTTEHGIFSCTHHSQTTRLQGCNHDDRRVSVNWRLQSDGNKCFTALKLWKQLNRRIRVESISYYYSNNKFIVCDPDPWEDIQELYIDFLVGIQDEGLTHLRHLTIKEVIYPSTPQTHYVKLMDLLQQCRLEYLDISIHPMWLLKERTLETREEVHGQVLCMNFDLPNFITNFKPLVKLRCMYLRLQAGLELFRYNQSKRLSKDIQKELEKGFKAALPNLHLTIEVKGW